MFDNLIITLWLVFAAAMLVLLFAGVMEINKYLLKTGKHPKLRWWMAQAITMAYKTSDQVFDMTNERLSGIDKTGIIKIIYIMLPEVITVFGIKLYWKRYVSQEMFMEHVSKYYDELVEQYHMVQHAVLREMVESVGYELPVVED